VVQIKDRHGNVIIEIAEDRFPLNIPLKTTWGDKLYHLKITYAKDKETHQKDFTKISGLMLN
jgi:hypothetical protein